MDLQNFVTETLSQLNSIERRLGAIAAAGAAPLTAQYVVMALDPSLSAERVITAGTAINIVDGGAGGNVTINVVPGNIDLDDLGDVNAPAPNPDDVLSWNDGAGEWQPVAIPGGAPSDAEYVVMALSGSLSAERKLTAGTNIDLTDGGADGNATIKVDDGGWTTNAILRTEGTTDLVADSAVFSLVPLTGFVGINESDPLTFLHIVYTDTGGARVSSSVLLLIEHDYDCYMQILCDLYDEAGIYFGHHDDPDEARIWYDTNWKEFRFQTNAAYFGKFASGGQFLLGGTTGLTPDAKLHVMESNASAGSHADSVLTVEKNDDCVIQILSAAANYGGLFFGDSTRGDDGQIGYNQNTQYMWFSTAQTEAIRITSSQHVGIQTSSPATHASATLTGSILHVVEVSGEGRLSVSGSTGANLNIIDTGGGADDKWFQIDVDAGVVIFRQIDDDAAASSYQFFICDLGTGEVYFPNNVGFGDETDPDTAVHVTETSNSAAASIKLESDTATFVIQVAGSNVAGRGNDFEIWKVGTGIALAIDWTNRYIGLRQSNPNHPLDINFATNDLGFDDAGTAGATEDGWIQVDIGGATHYIRTFTTK
jgi:hypothetical protein